MTNLREDTALIVLSGGQDSTTCLYWAMQRYPYIHAVTFNYGQRHSREVDAAATIARKARVLTHEVLRLEATGEIAAGFGDLGETYDVHQDILRGTSPLTNTQEKLEQYQDWQSLPGGLEKTFVPGRNALFLTLAANRAYCLGAGVLVTGLCQEDSGGYPDCREDFRQSMELALRQALDAPLMIKAPLMDLTKADSVRLAMKLPGCMAALAWSHTSYDGAYPPTGHDHATLLRAKGFEQADVADPLIVRAWHERLMELPPSPNYAAYSQMSHIPVTDNTGRTFICSCGCVYEPRG